MKRHSSICACSPGRKPRHLYADDICLQALLDEVPAMQDSLIIDTADLHNASFSGAACAWTSDRK